MEQGQAEPEGAGMTLRGAILAAALFAAFLLVYAGSISNHLTGDSIWYAHDILMPGDQFFHPHHLLYNPMMRLALLPFVPALPGPESKIVLLQWFNILISAMVPAIFSLVATRAGVGTGSAAAFSVMLGLSGSFHGFSSQIEVYGMTCIFLCTALIGLIAAEDSWRNRGLIALGYAGAMLFHQTAIIFGIAIAIVELGRRSVQPRHLARRLLVTLVIPLVFVGLVYLVIGASIGHRDPISLWRWLMMHVQMGHWGKGTLSSETFELACSRALMALMTRTPATKWLPLFLCMALGIYLAARLAAAGRPRHLTLIIANLAWMCVLASFCIWWDARGAEFWGMVLLPGLFALALASVGPGQDDAAASRLLDHACLAASLILFAVSAVTHYSLNQQPNEARQAAQVVGRLARDGDLIVAEHSTYYRIYVDNPRVTVLSVNVKPAREAARRRTSSTFAASMLDWLDDQARTVGSHGGRCLVDRWVLEGRFSTTRLPEELDLREFTSELRSRFLTKPLEEGLEPLIYQLLPLPERPHPPQAPG